MRLFLRPPTGLRAFLAAVAIMLNLLGSGVPLLHAAAHAGEVHSHHVDHAPVLDHDNSRDHGSSLALAAHSQEPDHVGALHDECIYVGKLSGAYLLPATPALVFAVPTEVEVPPLVHPSVQLRSRAPPPGDPARAPPQF